MLDRLRNIYALSYSPRSLKMLNPSGTAVLYSAPYRASNLAVDSDGYVYLTGSTANVTNFTTPNAAQPNFGGGYGDAFIQKIDKFTPPLVLHPAETDFDPQKAGRVLISTRHDDVYYTTVRTTKANAIAQTEDAKVTITAHLPAASAGQTVYFRLVTPDPDDLSPYERDAAGNLDTLPGDNLPLTDPFRAGKLNGGVAPVPVVATAATINGKAVAAAEVELTITDRYAGNNYQVEASLDATFASGVERTAVLVAWKRCYLEIDRMYAKGATMLAGFPSYPEQTGNKSGDGLDDTLPADNTDDFAVGDVITLFSRDEPTVDTTVVAKTTTTLTVADIVLPNPALNLPGYSGIKLRNNNDTIPLVSTRFLPQAFGDATDGSDGGTFVEFNSNAISGWASPKYTRFPSLAAAQTFCIRWFKFGSNNSNVFQLLTSLDQQSGNSGVAATTENTATVFTRIFNDSTSNDEIAVHEVGHLFDLVKPVNTHIDEHVDALNHEGSDHCVMSYNNILGNGITEFEWSTILPRNDCLYLVRNGDDSK